MYSYRMYGRSPYQYPSQRSGQAWAHSGSGAPPAKPREIHMKVRHAAGFMLLVMAAAALSLIGFARAPLLHQLRVGSPAAVAGQSVAAPPRTAACPHAERRIQRR